MDLSTCSVNPVFQQRHRGPIHVVSGNLSRAGEHLGDSSIEQNQTSGLLWSRDGTEQRLDHWPRRPGRTSELGGEKMKCLTGPDAGGYWLGIGEKADFATSKSLGHWETADRPRCTARWGCAETLRDGREYSWKCRKF
jgi:hypothetical protein